MQKDIKRLWLEGSSLYQYHIQDVLHVLYLRYRLAESIQMAEVYVWWIELLQVDTMQAEFVPDWGLSEVKHIGILNKW